MKFWGLVTALWLAGGVSSLASESGQVVARVGGQTITAAELGRELEERGRDAGALATEVRRQALDRLVERKLLVQAAIDAGYLDDAGVRYAIEGVLVQRYRQQHLDALLDVPAPEPAAVEAFYDAHRDLYRLPSSRRAAVLQLEGKKPDALAAAQVVRRRALHLDSDDFGPLAAEYSYDRATRYRGGDMGPMIAGVAYRWPKEVVDAAFALQRVRETSEPIVAAGSIWLVRLSAAGETTYRPLAQVRATIEHELARRERAERLDAALGALRAAIAVSVDEAALATVEPPAAPEPPALPRDSADAETPAPVTTTPSPRSVP